MMDYVSNLVWGTQPLSQKEAYSIKNQLTEYKDTIIKRLDNIKSLSEKHKTQKNPNTQNNKSIIQNNEYIIQISRDNTIPIINNLINYIKLDPYITFSQESTRLKTLENTIEQITEKFSTDEIETYKANITDVHDATQTMIKSLLENQSNKIQSTLEASTITFNKVQAENKKTRFINSPNDLISYINAQKWEENIQIFILQLLWSNEFYQGGLKTDPDNLRHHNNRQLYSTALNRNLPHFTEDSEGYKKLPTLILPFNDFKKVFNNVDCDETLKNFINQQLNTLIFIQERNIQFKAKKIQQNKQNQAAIVKNLKTAIIKKEKQNRPITINKLQKYLQEMQRLLKLEESSSTETVNKSKNNKITNLSEEIKITSEKIEKKIQLAQAKEATTKIQQQLKHNKQNNQISSINDLQAYIGALNKERSLLGSDEAQKEELTTRIRKAEKLIETIDAKKLINQQAMNQREHQKELVKNNPTKENLLEYERLLKIHLDSRLSEIIKQEIKQRLKDIDEQLKKIEYLDGLQKALETADTLYSLHCHAKSIIQSHMLQLIPSSFNNPFDKKIIEHLTRCLQKINTMSIVKGVEGFYDLIELSDTLASHFEIPNNNNNNITLNDDVILEFKGEYLDLTENLMTSLDVTSDDDKNTLERLKKNIVQVTRQLEKEIEELREKINKIENEKEIEELREKIDKIENEKETEELKREITKIEIKLDKTKQQNLDQEKIEQEKINKLAVSFYEQYDHNDLSPALLIHYDLKTLEESLEILKNSKEKIKHNIELEKCYTKTFECLTTVQTKLQKANDTISSYKSFLKDGKYSAALINFNGICNNINVLIQYLPTKELTDINNNTLYQDLIETLLGYVNQIEKCSDLKVTNINQLEKLVNILKKYENIDPENINTTIKTVNGNIKHLKEIEDKIEFYSQLTENELLFHNARTLKDDEKLQYQFKTQSGLLTLGKIADKIYLQRQDMGYYRKPLTPSNQSSDTHTAQINKIIKDLDNLKDITDISAKIIEYKKNSLYQDIITTINYCLEKITIDQTKNRLKLINQLENLYDKFETYAKFDKDNFNPMMERLEEIIYKKPSNGPSQVNTVPLPQSVIVSPSNNQQPNYQTISTVQQNNTNIINLNNQTPEEKKDTGEILKLVQDIDRTRTGLNKFNGNQKLANQEKINQSPWTFFSNPITWTIMWPFKKAFSICSWFLSFLNPF